MNLKLQLILLVDDDQDDNFIHKLEIEGADIAEQIDICLDGQDALDYLSSEGKYEERNFPRPDIIFLDINMPRMDGWDFLEHYKNLPEEKRGGEVIVMLTTSLNPDDRIRAERMGIVCDFLGKPLLRKDLINIVERYHAKNHLPDHNDNS